MIFFGRSNDFQATELGYVPIHPDVVSRIEEYWRSRFAEAIFVSKQP